MDVDVVVVVVVGDGAKLVMLGRMAAVGAESVGRRGEKDVNVLQEPLSQS
jgi:hypothetical protein